MQNKNRRAFIMASFTSHYESLSCKIETRKAIVGVVGLGYVGLPLCHCFSEAGFQTMGYDVVPSKIDGLSRGEINIDSLKEKVKSLHSSGSFTPTCDMSRLAESDIIMICVPTPVREHMEPDLSYIISSAENIRKTLRPGQLIILESTTYPGTTRKEVRSILDKANLVLGIDYFLAYSPEREDPGNLKFDTAIIPKLVGGVDEKSGNLAESIYKSGFAGVHRVSSCCIAESAKLMENIYRAVNIALVNELKMVFHRMDIDIWEVLDAAATKPFGFQRFNPGPGWGGHCIPVDPFYLTWKAKEYGMHSHFIERAGEINTKMPEFVVSNVQSALNDKRKPLNGSKVILLGIAYKSDVDDCRETPSFRVWEMLMQKGAIVSYHDPHVDVIPQTREFPQFSGVKSTMLTKENLCDIDCVIVLTNHKKTDLSFQKWFTGIIIDTRGTLVGDNVIRS